MAIKSPTGVSLHDMGPTARTAIRELGLDNGDGVVSAADLPRIDKALASDGLDTQKLKTVLSVRAIAAASLLKAPKVAAKRLTDQSPVKRLIERLGTSDAPALVRDTDLLKTLARMGTSEDQAALHAIALREGDIAVAARALVALDHITADDVRALMRKRGALEALATRIDEHPDRLHATGLGVTDLARAFAHPTDAARQAILEVASQANPVLALRIMSAFGRIDPDLVATQIARLPDPQAWFLAPSTPPRALSDFARMADHMRRDGNVDGLEMLRVAYARHAPQEQLMASMPAGLDNKCAFTAKPGPICEQRFMIGDTTVNVWIYEWQKAPTVFINVHDNENTAAQAGREHVRESGGTLVELKHIGQRNILFALGQRTFQFDPNRIFTPDGIRKTLQDQGGTSPEAEAAVKRFSDSLVREFGLTSPPTVVALHNNTDGGQLHINSYVRGGAYAREAAATSVNPSIDPDDFFLVTKRAHHDRLKAARQNVVLQDNANATDDGSLSVLRGKLDLPYVNVEAQHEHLVQQKKMLETLGPLLRTP